MPRGVYQRKLSKLDRPDFGLDHRNSRVNLLFEPLELEMISEAARLTDLRRTVWIRRTLVWEALRVRMASTNTPHGLHPGTKVYRVTEVYAPGRWQHALEFEAQGHERIWVSSLVEDAPSSMSADRRALVIDVVGYRVCNLLVPFDGVRWTASTPLGFHYYDKQRAHNEAQILKNLKRAEASLSENLPPSGADTEPDSVVSDTSCSNAPPSQEATDPCSQERTDDHGDSASS